jgi:hypothetical protein
MQRTSSSSKWIDDDDFSKAEVYRPTVQHAPLDMMPSRFFWRAAGWLLNANAPQWALTPGVR